MDVLDALKEWGGWVAGGALGLWSLRDGRIDERVTILVQPGTLHAALERIEGKVDNLDAKLDDIAERTAHLEGKAEAGPPPSEFAQSARMKP